MDDSEMSFIFLIYYDIIRKSNYLYYWKFMFTNLYI